MKEMYHFKPHDLKLSGPHEKTIESMLSALKHGSTRPLLFYSSRVYQFSFFF